MLLHAYFGGRSKATEAEIPQTNMRVFGQKHILAFYVSAAAPPRAETQQASALFTGAEQATSSSNGKCDKQMVLCVQGQRSGSQTLFLSARLVPAMLHVALLTLVPLIAPVQYIPFV